MSSEKIQIVNTFKCQTENRLNPKNTVELKHVLKKCSSYKIYTLGSKLDSIKLMRIFFSTQKKRKKKENNLLFSSNSLTIPKETFNFLGHAERHR